MDILTKLGIDYTLFYQLAIFIVAYFALSRLLFKPYLKAYHKRLEATFGGQEAAEKINQEAQELHVKYEAKAREVNSKVQSYFEQAQKRKLFLILILRRNNCYIAFYYHQNTMDSRSMCLHIK
jgi:F0F1-type ATP synthase membrane subunit b/b'